MWEAANSPILDGKWIQREGGGDGNGSSVAGEAPETKAPHPFTRCRRDSGRIKDQQPRRRHPPGVG